MRAFTSTCQTVNCVSQRLYSTTLWCKNMYTFSLQRLSTCVIIVVFWSVYFPLTGLMWWQWTHRGMYTALSVSQEYGPLDSEPAGQEVRCRNSREHPVKQTVRNPFTYSILAPRRSTEIKKNDGMMMEWSELVTRTTHAQRSAFETFLMSYGATWRLEQNTQGQSLWQNYTTGILNSITCWRGL